MNDLLVDIRIDTLLIDIEGNIHEWWDNFSDATWRARIIAIPHDYYMEIPNISDVIFEETLREYGIEDVYSNYKVSFENEKALALFILKWG